MQNVNGLSGYYSVKSEETKQDRKRYNNAYAVTRMTDDGAEYKVWEPPEHSSDKKKNVIGTVNAEFRSVSKTKQSAIQTKGVPYVEIGEDEHRNVRPYTEGDIFNLNRKLSTVISEISNDDPKIINRILPTEPVASEKVVSAKRTTQPTANVLPNDPMPKLRANLDLIFRPPQTLREIRKDVWTNMFTYLSPLFAQKIREHLYIMELMYRYTPKSFVPMDQRIPKKLEELEEEAIECGLFKKGFERVSKEYCVVKLTFLQPNEEEEDGSGPVETHIKGENLEREFEDEDELTSTIEDVIVINMILIYCGNITESENRALQESSKKKDDRLLKFGAIFLTTSSQ
jgi:hypothetical protein